MVPILIKQPGIAWGINSTLSALLEYRGCGRLTRQSPTMTSFRMRQYGKTTTIDSILANRNTHLKQTVKIRWEDMWICWKEYYISIDNESNVNTCLITRHDQMMTKLHSPSLYINLSYVLSFIHVIVMWGFIYSTMLHSNKSRIGHSRIRVVYSCK